MFTIYYLVCQPTAAPRFLSGSEIEVRITVEIASAACRSFLGNFWPKHTVLSAAAYVLLVESRDYYSVNARLTWWLFVSYKYDPSNWSYYAVPSSLVLNFTKHDVQQLQAKNEHDRTAAVEPDTRHQALTRTYTQYIFCARIKKQQSELFLAVFFFFMDAFC